MLITYSTQYAKPHTILILGFLLRMQLHCRIATAKEKAQNDHDQGTRKKVECLLRDALLLAMFLSFL